MTTAGYDAALGTLVISPGTVTSPQDDLAPDIASAKLALASATRKEIVFIEDNVADYQTIASQAGAGREVVILDSHADGLQQIVSVLAGRTGIDALHIVSHGAAGTLNLGAVTLDNATLSAHAAELQAIGRSMAPNGDMLLYGCDVAAGGGTSFVEQLAIATGADVAASDDPTGSAALGGDWNLEVVSGSIETAAVGNAALASTYQQVLALPSSLVVDFNTASNFSGEGSHDLYYKVNGDAAYQLHITGKDWAYSDDRSGWTRDVVSYGYGADAEISFKDGQLFNLSSMTLRGTNNYLIKFIGLGNDGNVVATQDWDLNHDSQFINFSGFTNIKVLRVTSNDGTPFSYFEFDDLGLANVHPFVSDSTPPAVPPAPAFASGSDTGTSATDGITRLTRPTFSGTAEAGATVKLYDTDQSTLLGSTTADGAGNWSITPAGAMSTGTHTVSVTATDAANNTSGFSSTLSVTIDTAAPSTPAAPALDAGSDSGVASDGITSATTPTVGGIADAGVTVTLYDSNGTTVLGTDVADGSGNWSITSSILAAGAHALTVKATDVAGNTGAASPALNLTIDTAAPNAPSTPDLDASSDTGVSNSDDVTGTTTPTFSGTAEAGATVTLYEGSTVLGSTVATGGTWSIASSTLGAGTHNISATATDAAGNSGTASSALAVTVVLDAPTTTPGGIAISADGGASGTDFITGTAAQTISGTLSAHLASGERVQVSVDGGTNWTTTSATAGADTWSLATTLDAGTHDIQVRVVNAVDNGGPVATRGYTLDTAAPSVTVTSDVAQLKSGDSATVTFTFSEDPGASFTLDDVAVSGGTLSALTGSGMVRSATFTPTAGVDGGTAGIAVTAGAYADLAGNAGTAGPTPVLAFDTSAPAAPSAPVLAAGSDSGTSGSDGITSDTTPTFSGTAESGATVKLYDGATEIGSAVAAGGTWTITANALGEGTHTITATATDAAGNTGSAGSAATVTVDTTAPTLAITSDVAQLKSGESATITFTFSEDPGTSFSLAGVTVTGGTLGALSGSGLTRTATFTPAAGVDGGSAGIDVGAGTYADTAGNAGGAGTTPALHFDTRAPAAPSTPVLAAGSDSGVSGSDNITGVTTPTFSGTAEAGTTVTLYEGTTVLGSTVATNGTWSITSSALGEGSHTISAGAVDAAGNAGVLSSGLTVRIDTTAPTTAIGNLALSADTGASGTDFVTGTAAQTVSGSLGAPLDAGEHVEVSLDGGASWNAATVNGTQWTFAGTLAAGTHTLQARVVDAVDNSGPVATRGYTLDTAAPSVAVTSDVAQLKIGGHATVTFTFSEDPGASFTLDDVAVSGGTLSALTGSGLVRSATFTPTAGVDGGTAGIAVTAGAYADLAGNAGTVGLTPALAFDTSAPAAPSAPVLAAGSDSGTSGSDGITSDTTPTFSGTAESGATVKLYDGATEIGSAVAAGGTWTITANALGEGTHTITATATDAAGNTGSAGSAATVTVDTTAPTLAITSDVAQLKSGESATITFTFSEDPGASFSLAGVTVTGGTLGALSGSGLTRTATFTPVAGVDGGSAGIDVGAGTYADTAGNAGGAGTTPSLHFDTRAPAAPSTPVLAAGSDSGVSGSDNITGVTTPTFSGTAEAGTTVTLYEGTTVLGSTVATNGTWSITSSALGEGSHTISAGAVDAAGNAGVLSSGLTVRIDTTAPTTAIGNLALSADTGASGTDFVTGTAAQTVSGSLGAPLDAGEHVEVSLDGGASWNAATVNGTQWTFAGTLAAGTHTLQARVVDAVDNSGPVATRGYTLDTAAPSVAVTSDVAQLKSGGHATVTFTFSEDPGASFTLDDVAVSGGTLSALTGSGLVRSATFTPTAGVDGGTAGIAVTAGAYADLAGNAGTAGPTPVLAFDTSAPAAPSAPVLAAGSDSGTSGSDGITSDTTPTFSGTAESGATVKLYDGATEIGSAVAAGGTWTITAGALGEGTHTITATATDAAGNTGSAGSAATVRIDATAPLAAAAPVLATASDSGTVGDGITKANRPTVNGSAEALAQVTLYDTDGHTVLGTTRAGADGKWSIVASALADGVHGLTVKQVDAAGNVSAASPALALTVDTAAPAAPGAPQLLAATDTGRVGDGITYAVPVMEGSAEAKALVTLYDGATVVGVGTADEQGHWSIRVTGLALGAHALSATQTDAAGNTSVAGASFALTIRPAPVQAQIVDGVSVTSTSTVLPSGVAATRVDVPLVTAGRVDTGGLATTADIPLATAGGTNLLLAQVGEGYGLSATGGASVAVGGAGTSLGAAIQAATTSSSAGDKSHLTNNAQSFLANLDSSHSLLVETIAPVSTAAPGGSLTLSGSGDAQQHVALVIQTAGLASGSTLTLQNVDFAAIVGAANVVAQGSTQMLSGDAASQHFTLASGGNTQVFAGGGDDMLAFGLPTPLASASGAAHAQVASTPTTTVLHGGDGNDTAVFNGARASFDVESHNGYLVVNSKAAPETKVLVVNAEQLQFSDATVAVENAADLSSVAALYQAVLGRQADVYGFEFWADQHDKGISLGAIAVDIIGSAERLDTQAGFTGNAEHDIGVLYASLFNRAADSAGLAFWTAAMQHGATLAEVADAIVHSAEVVGQQKTPLDWNFSM